MQARGSVPQRQTEQTNGLREHADPFALSSNQDDSSDDGVTMSCMTEERLAQVNTAVCANTPESVDIFSI